MKKTGFVKIALLLMVVLVVTACNLPCAVQTGSTSQPGGDDDGGIEIFANPTEEIDSKPVGIQEGLGSLDSYKIEFSVNTYDSNGSKNDVNEVIERSIVDGNSHSITTETQFDPAADTEESTSVTEVYEIGNVTCTTYDSGATWTYQSMSDQDKEMMDAFRGMVDLVPVINDPEFVGEENINEMDTNHFTFQVAGLGDTSGSVVNVNEGDYWLALDGNFIVKYQLALELQSAADDSGEAVISNIDAKIDLTNINQPVPLSLPATCVPAPAE
jgi:hypothetical protein